MRAGLRTNAKVVGNKSTPASVVGPTVAPYLYIPYHTVSYVVGSSSSVARKGAPPTRSRQYRCSSVRPSATACRYSAARRARYRRCRSAFVSGRVVVIAESYRATLHVATRASSGPGRCPSTAGHGQGRRGRASRNGATGADNRKCAHSNGHARTARTPPPGGSMRTVALVSMKGGSGKTTAADC